MIRQTPLAAFPQTACPAVKGAEDLIDPINLGVRRQP
jgi:hypothetical protein